jgi:hypothetical protein
MRGCILILITLCFLGCDDHDPNPADKTVHIAGFVVNSTGGATASYWEDGAHTALTHDSIYSNVHSLYVDGSSVLIGGWKWNPSPSKSVIWQDGTENIIEGTFGGNTLIASRNNKLFGVWHDSSLRWVYSKNGTIHQIIDTAYNIGANGLALLGDDMYIAGSSAYHDGKPDSKTYQHAQCWKNGQLIFRENELSNAMSIFIHQNDIYMAGYFENGAFPGNNACYWKNGQRVDLTGAYAIGLSVFVAGGHVYVSGYMDQQAVYWKDGEMTVLSTPGSYSAANSIFVQGTDVYVAGAEHGYPALWKNDVKQIIQNQEKRGELKFVVVGSN